jgi:hypothetical protein
MRGLKVAGLVVCAPLVLSVDPLEYLADVLPILTRDIRLADMPALLPVRWKARRDAATSAQ